MELAELYGSLIALISGSLVSLAMTGLKKTSVAVDKLPVRVKQAIILVVAFGVVKLNGLLGITLPVDALGWSADAVNTLLTSVIAFGSYDLLKIRKPA